MPFIPYKDNRGVSWAVDLDGVWHVLWADAYAVALLKRSQPKLERDGFGPDLVIVETKFDGIRKQVEKDSQTLMADLESRFVSSGEEVFGSLIELREETLSKNAAFREMQRQASETTFGNMNRSLAIGKRGEEVATIIRDGAEFVLMIGATFLSGGAALTAVAGRAAVKSTTKYTETNNVGSALLELNANLFVGFIGAAAGKAKGVEKGALVVIGAQYDAANEFAQTMLEGKDLKKATKAAAAKFGTDIGGAVVGSLIEEKILAKVAIPALVHQKDALNKMVDVAMDRTGEYMVGKLKEADPARSSDPTWVPAGARVPHPVQPYSAKDFIRLTAMRRLN